MLQRASKSSSILRSDPVRRRRCRTHSRPPLSKVGEHSYFAIESRVVPIDFFPAWILAIVSIQTARNAELSRYLTRPHHMSLVPPARQCWSHAGRMHIVLALAGKN